MDSKGGVDAGAVDSLALHVEVANRRAHALGGAEHDIDVRAELGALVFHDAEEEAMGKAEGGPGLHGRQDARVQLGLHGIGLGGGEDSSGGRGLMKSGTSRSPTVGGKIYEMRTRGLEV